MSAAHLHPMLRRYYVRIRRSHLWTKPLVQQSATSGLVHQPSEHVTKPTNFPPNILLAQTRNTWTFR